MSDLQTIADRVEIEALRAEFTDAALMRDWDRFASLFTPDGAWRMPYVNVEFLSREAIRAGIERMQDLWDYFLRTTHPGTIELAGDTAVGRAYVTEFGRFRDGRSQLHFSVYHDRYHAPLTAGSSPSASTDQIPRHHPADGLAARRAPGPTRGSSPARS